MKLSAAGDWKRKRSRKRKAGVEPGGAGAQHLEGGVVHKELGGHRHALRPEQPHPARPSPGPGPLGSTGDCTTLTALVLLLLLLLLVLHGSCRGQRQRAAEVVDGGHGEAADERRVGHEFVGTQVHVAAHAPEGRARLRLHVAVALCLDVPAAAT